MPDWKAILDSRLAERRISPVHHLSVIEELSQHLDDRYRSLTRARCLVRGCRNERAGGAGGRRGARARIAWAERRARPTHLSSEPTAHARWLRGFWQDVRYAARAVVEEPGVYVDRRGHAGPRRRRQHRDLSIINAVMLRPLPYPEPHRLVRIWESNVERGWPAWSMSEPNFLDFRARTTMFDAIAASSGQTFTMTGTDGAGVCSRQPRHGGIPPGAWRAARDWTELRGGRGSPGRERARRDSHDGFWRRRFGSDRSIVGHTIPLDGANHLVVGILPPSFQWGTTDLLVPLAPNPKGDRDDHRLTAIGRLRTAPPRPGSQRTGRHRDGIGRAVPGVEQGVVRAPGVVLRLADPGAGAQVASDSLWRGRRVTAHRVRERRQPPARARRRSPEGALHSRGARWSALANLQTAIDGVVAACAGSGPGGPCAGAATTRLLVAYGPASLPRLSEAGLDITVVLFALAMSIATVLAFGLVPAIQVSRQHPADTLREGTRGAADWPGSACAPRSSSSKWRCPSRS